MRGDVQGAQDRGSQVRAQWHAPREGDAMVHRTAPANAGANIT
jgi:hypothetical protein